MNEDQFVSWLQEFSKDSNVYAPDLKDLFSLYSHVKEKKVTTILEIGSGWSTLVLAQALLENRNEFETVYLQENKGRMGFRMISLDASSHYLEVAISRLNNEHKELVSTLVSTPKMTKVANQICHVFELFPNFCADLIYLDGPDCDQVLGDVNGVSVNPNQKSGGLKLPMAGDLLQIEHFIEPGSWIIVDGRGANSEFMRNNFKRNWQYEYIEKLDQHFFYLDSPSWGLKNTKHKNR